ncbi:MAG: MFS transporter [Armatimonadetes bacterium]|nr:MFS transporter [Armatimonadota bacterium]
MRENIRGLLGKYRALVALSIVAGMAELGYGIVNQSAIPPYVRELGLARHIGIIFATFLVAETLLKSPMGSLGDRIGRRPLLVSGALLSACVSLGIVAFPRLWSLLALRALDGVAAAAVWPTMVAAMCASVPEGRRTTAMSALTVMYIGGVALGPLIGGYANDATDSRATSFYLVSGIFLLTAACAYLLVPRRFHEEHHLPPSPSLRGEAAAAPVPERPFRIGDLLVGLKALPDMMLMAFCAFFAIGLLMPIIKLFAMEELRMTETHFGGLILPIALAVAGVSLFSGPLTDRWGKARSVKLGIFLTALAMWTITVISRPLHFAIAGAVLGIGFAVAMPAWLAIVSGMSASRTRGAVVGALGTAQGIGAIAGAAVGSYLYRSVPLRLGGVVWGERYVPFVASAVMLTVALALCVLFVRDGDRRGVH